MSLKSQFQVAQPWVSLLVRLGAAASMLWAGLAKVSDVNASIAAVGAYKILPPSIVPLVGHLLPWVEIILGVVLAIGLVTRFSAVIYSLMMVAFIIGLIWVWAKGYSIDCGCFGGGGEVAPGETNYLSGLLERLGFLAMGTWLIFFPRSKFSVDSWLHPAPKTVGSV